MPLEPGTHLGQFEVLSRIGAGGMGEVYRARDVKLGRDAAIKVLHQAAGADPDRLRRFEREARAASALNHPNIITVFDVGEAAAGPYIAMEWVSGSTLGKLIQAGPLPVREILEIGTQIANGLAKAHEAGIVHRDLKPENLMVTEDGFVKILDFGLAKLTIPVSEGFSEGITADIATRSGMILGTVGYMSPEQARGRSADFRSDLFSLGTILYEMVTGIPAFRKNSAVQTLSAIIEEEPEPLQQLNPDVPEPLRRVIERCLAKDPEKRHGSTRDLAQELKAIRDGLTAATSAGVVRISRPHVGRKAAALSIATLAIVGALGALLWFRGAAEPGIDSIAVMPFVNASGDPETAYLSDGISESIINSLSRIEGLRVVPRSVTFRHRQPDLDPLAVGKELGVRSVLTGRVVQRADSLNVQAELIDVGRRSQLWGEQYRRKAPEALSIQAEIATEITQALRLQLSGAEAARLARRETENNEAYQAYLRGRYFWNQWQPGSLLKAVELYRQAIAIDPGYARAYAGLAETYVTLVPYAGMPAEQALGNARTAALRALELDEGLAEGHHSLGVVRLNLEWDWEGAEREFKRAMDIAPEYAQTRSSYGLGLAMVGRFDEAVASAERGRALDPVAFPPNLFLAHVYLMAKRYDESIAQFQRTIELYPQIVSPRIEIAHAYAAKGLFDQALATLNAAGYRGVVQARILALAGRRQEALAILRGVEERAEQGAPVAVWVASVYAALGDTAAGMRWVSQAIANREFFSVFVRAHPGWSGLSSHPQFFEVLAGTGIPWHGPR